MKTMNGSNSCGGGMDASVPMEVIKGKIYLIRGQKVLLDSDLADLYGIETKNLNKAVKRPIYAGLYVSTDK